MSVNVCVVFEEGDEKAFRYVGQSYETFLVLGEASKGIHVMKGAQLIAIHYRPCRVLFEYDVREVENDPS